MIICEIGDANGDTDDRLFSGMKWAICSPYLHLAVLLVFALKYFLIGRGDIQY